MSDSSWVRAPSAPETREPAGPTRWRKKPVVIEAWQFTRKNAEAVRKWCGGKFLPDLDMKPYAMIIETLEGEHRADFGVWIICGVQGEFYPCRADIFERTYEAA